MGRRPRRAAPPPPQWRGRPALATPAARRPLRAGRAGVGPRRPAPPPRNDQSGGRRPASSGKRGGDPTGAGGRLPTGARPAVTWLRRANQARAGGTRPPPSRARDRRAPPLAALDPVPQRRTGLPLGAGPGGSPGRGPRACGSGERGRSGGRPGLVSRPHGGHRPASERPGGAAPRLGDTAWPCVTPRSRSRLPSAGSARSTGPVRGAAAVRRASDTSPPPRVVLTAHKAGRRREGRGARAARKTGRRQRLRAPREEAETREACPRRLVGVVGAHGRKEDVRGGAGPLVVREERVSAGTRRRPRGLGRTRGAAESSRPRRPPESAGAGVRARRRERGRGTGPRSACRTAWRGRCTLGRARGGRPAESLAFPGREGPDCRRGPEAVRAGGRGGGAAGTAVRVLVGDRGRR
nr:translation initiation factor IF-2-like [Equus asinus]